MVTSIKINIAVCQLDNSLPTHHQLENPRYLFLSSSEAFIASNHAHLPPPDHGPCRLYLCSGRGRRSQQRWQLQRRLVSQAPCCSTRNVNESQVVEEMHPAQSPAGAASTQTPTATTSILNAATAISATGIGKGKHQARTIPVDYVFDNVVESKYDTPNRCKIRP